MPPEPVPGPESPRYSLEFRILDLVPTVNCTLVENWESNVQLTESGQADRSYQIREMTSPLMPEIKPQSTQ
jgi:hypothetical protein